MADLDREDRYDISISGHLRTHTGKRDVTIVDLSEHGCRIYDRDGALREGNSVSLRIGPIGPVEGTIRWHQNPYAGIRFENPLYPAVLDHIRTHFDLRSLGGGYIDSAPGKYRD